jgi:hypothetical protein
MYFFLLHLSLADILTAFFSLLPEILWTLTLPEFYGGNLLCRTMKFLQVSFSTTGNIDLSRLHWYGGVTVLLPGQVIWK